MALGSLVAAAFDPSTAAPARVWSAADFVASSQASAWIATLMVLIGLVGLAALMSVLRIIPRRRLTELWDAARSRRPKRRRRLGPGSTAPPPQRRRAGTPQAARRSQVPLGQRIEQVLVRIGRALKRFAIAVLLVTSAMATHVWHALVRLWHALVRWSRIGAHHVRRAAIAAWAWIRTRRRPAFRRPNVHVPHVNVRRPSLRGPQLRLHLPEIHLRRSQRPQARSTVRPAIEPMRDELLDPLPPLHEHYHRYPRFRDAALYTLGAIAGGIVAAAIAIYLTIFFR